MSQPDLEMLKEALKYQVFPTQNAGNVISGSLTTNEINEVIVAALDKGSELLAARVNRDRGEVIKGILHHTARVASLFPSVPVVVDPELTEALDEEVVEELDADVEDPLFSISVTHEGDIILTGGDYMVFATPAKVIDLVKKLSWALDAESALHDRTPF